MGDDPDPTRAVRVDRKKTCPCNPSLDQNGTVVWRKRYDIVGAQMAFGFSISSKGGDDAVMLHDAVALPSGAVFAVGIRRLDGYAGFLDDSLVLKLGDTQELEWARVFDGATSESFEEVAALPDGKIAIAGQIGGGTYLSLSVLSHAGDPVWSKQYSHGTFGTGGNSVEALDDSGFLLSGYMTTVGIGGADSWLVRADATGNIPSCSDLAFDIAVAPEAIDLSLTDEPSSAVEEPAAGTHPTAYVNDFEDGEEYCGFAE